MYVPILLIALGLALITNELKFEILQENCKCQDLLLVIFEYESLD